MGKSYAQLADEILNGALTDPAKNPMNPSTGHQSDLPAMDPKDKLVEMSDSQRTNFLKGTAGVKVEEITEGRKVKHDEPTTTMELTPQDLETLSEAKKIIEKIQEATTVGCLGVNYASKGQGGDPTSIKLPGDVNVSSSPKRRTKKKVKTEDSSPDFLSYLKA